MISNYWLGTFNLLTLQFVSVVTALEYVPFMAVALCSSCAQRRLGFLVFPAAWTVFDWLRSMGFLGYPWGMLGRIAVLGDPGHPDHLAHRACGASPSSSMLCNSVIAWYAGAPLTRSGRGAGARDRARGRACRSAWAGRASACGREAGAAPRGSRETVRLALIQQNDDPAEGRLPARLSTRCAG